MEKLTQEDIHSILNLHDQWLKDLPGGKRANLSYTNLSYTNLSKANLSYADLSYTNLWNANLSYTNLSNANLSNADLSKANLSNANLSYTNLWNANLSYADLSYTNLWNEKIYQVPIQLSGFKYHIQISGTHLKIGCELHTIEEWKKFKKARIEKMDCNAWQWWIEHKPLIMPLAITHMEKHLQQVGENK